MFKQFGATERQKLKLLDHITARFEPAESAQRPNPLGLPPVPITDELELLETDKVASTG